MNDKGHWEKACAGNYQTEVSWFQARPELSIRLIASSGLDKRAGVIDVGGGVSSLVDCLLDAGYSPVAVLDLSGVALEHARRRLGARSSKVDWFEADVTTFNPPRSFGLWHDRAVFHFLTEAEKRRGYVDALRRTLAPNGVAIIATFAKDGPARCSGLPVERYDAQSLSKELGPEFSLVEQASEILRTPWNTEQAFAYFSFRKMPSG